MSLGGEHLHHYMWGIGMLAGVGAVAVNGDEKLRRHPATALVYGGGLALIVDEFALLLDLQDVYWAKEGRISVDVAIGGIAAAAASSPPFRCSGRSPAAFVSEVKRPKVASRRRIAGTASVARSQLAA